jgi:hypothetical protein
VRERAEVIVQIRIIRTTGVAILAIGVLMLPARSEAEVTEAKQEMIRELLTIVGVVGMAEQMRDQQSVVELMRMQPSYHEMMEWATSEQPDLSEENRQLLLARLEDFDAFAERFQALFIERINFSTIIETVYPPLYDKAFSEEELRQMVTFYRTPVGRKSIEVMAPLMQEAGRGIEEAVRPHAIGLIQEIVAEERAALAD